MAVTGLITFQGSSGSITAGQPVNVTVTLTNQGASDVTVSTLSLFATSNSLPYAGVTFGRPTTRAGNTTVAAAGGQLTYSFGVVFRTPQGSAENQESPSWAALTGVLMGVTATFSDATVLNLSQTVTPTILGATAPAAAGQFLFASPLNSPNFLLW